MRPGRRNAAAGAVHAHLHPLRGGAYCCVDCGLHVCDDTHGHFGSMAFPIEQLTESYAPEPDPITLEALVAELSTAAE